MTFHILTLFPEMFDVMRTSIIGRAIENGIVGLRTYQIRDFSADEKHHKVDDYTYGGGAGMLMQAQPVFDCYLHVLSGIEKTKNGEIIDEKTCTETRTEVDGISDTEKRQVSDDIENTSSARRPRMVCLTPQGVPLTQEKAAEYARCEDLILLCGHYEGIDERVLEATGAERVSIGDYVLTGGELPAMVMMDAVARLVPGVLPNEESAQTESFDNGLLEYPQYTRPEIWNGRSVPEVLLSGDHAKVDAWRHAQRLERTREMRPDLYEAYVREGRGGRGGHGDGSFGTPGLRHGSHGNGSSGTLRLGDGSAESHGDGSSGPFPFSSQDSEMGQKNRPRGSQPNRPQGAACQKNRPHGSQGAACQKNRPHVPPSPAQLHDASQYFQVAQVAGTHALKGEVKVFPMTDDPARFTPDLLLWMEDVRGGVQPLTVEASRPHGKFVLLKFRGLDNVNDVERFRGSRLYVDRRDAIPLGEGEFFVADLIGLTVADEDGNLIGHLTDVLETGANDVYAVQCADTGEELLLPVIPSCIRGVDLDKRLITVRLMEGMR